jgi:hypothetical protein
MASRMKVLLLGGIAVAAGTVAYLKRERVAGLLPSSAQEPAAPPPPPAPSNYDAPGPPANTATPVPAPEPQVHPAGLDEQAEVDAAAAEAANIGGARVEYAGPAGEPAAEALRPLAEAGGGESEGQEQAEADLVENAILRDAGTTGAEQQLEEAIEQQHNTLAGELAEPVVSEAPAEPAAPTPPPAEPPVPITDQPTVPDQRAVEGPDEPSPAAPSTTEDAPTEDAPTEPPTSAVDVPAEDVPTEQPTSGEDAPPADEPTSGKDAPPDDDGGWKTWSGRSVGS